MTGRPVPEPSELTRPFWDATRERALLLQWCRGCAQPVLYPRFSCPACGSGSLEWRRAGGGGSLYSWTTVPKPLLPFMAGREPYVICLVDLDEGGRLLAGLVTGPGDSLAAGARVTVGWEPLDDGRNLPVFTVAKDTDR